MTLIKLPDLQNLKVQPKYQDVLIACAPSLREVWCISLGIPALYKVFSRLVSAILRVSLSVYG